MLLSFPKFSKKQKINYYSGKQQLLAQIKKSKESLDLAYANFENMTAPELIDCSIYELQAAQTRYEYLLSCAKEYDMCCLYDQVIS